MSTLAAGGTLAMDAVSELQERGFVVIAGPVPPDRLDPLINAYTTAAKPYAFVLTAPRSPTWPPIRSPIFPVSTR